MWQRARTDEQRAEREREILSAAAALFESTPYEEVTLSDIAAEADFTRSNVYRYFCSREEIFLRLYRLDLQSWLGELRQALPRSAGDAGGGDADAGGGAPPRFGVVEFVGLWTEVLMRQERLLRLTPLLTISLERNESEELYREFKQFMRETTAEAASLLRPYVSPLSADQLIRFFVVHQALVAGGMPMGQYSDMQRRVLETPELSHLRVDFEELYRSTMAAYLRGIRPAGTG